MKKIYNVLHQTISSFSNLLLTVIFFTSISMGVKAQTYSISGTIDLSEVQNLPSDANICLAGYATTTADPYNNTPAWVKSFPYSGGQSLSYTATSLPMGSYIIYSFIDVNKNGVFDASEKLARDGGMLSINANLADVNINFPEDIFYKKSGWNVMNYLQTLPKPRFNNASMIPYLTKCGWGESNEISLELGKHWRYAVEINHISGGEWGDQSVINLAKEIAKSPNDYKTQSTWYLANTYKDDSFFNKYQTAYVFDTTINQRLVRISPVAPDSLFKELGKKWADNIQTIQNQSGFFKVDYLINGGESGLEIPASGWDNWHKDKYVMKDYNNSIYKSTDSDWYLYISDKKAQHEAWISQTAKINLNNLLGTMPTYIYYGGGYNPNMGRWNGCHWYDFAYSKFLEKNAVDYSATEFYYGLHNSGFSGMSPWVPFDIMTQAVNVYAGETQYTQKIKTPFVSCGWVSDDNTNVSPQDRWIGYLKLLGLTGAVSPVVSNFDDWQATKPQRLENAAVDTADTHIQWIWQYILSSHVHAFFTQYDNYIYNGSLVASSLNHPYNADPYYSSNRPLYMFYPTGEFNGVAGESTTGVKACVVARKLNGQNKFLVLAWANTGNDRNVSVNIPEIGNQTLFARTAGTLYEIEVNGANINKQILDPGAMNPTACLAVSNPQVIAVTGISVTPSTVSINISETQQLNTFISPTNASNKNITWASSNNAVAAVNTSGLVTGVAQGTALIIATTNDGNKKDTCVVTVSNIVATITVLTTQTPASTGNDGDYELGMKFRSTQAGQITKIRYYKPIGETGSHTGRIWSATGTQLASVTFTGETDSGWQEATLASPLTISENTTYIVSVNANSVYPSSDNGLQTSIVNGYLSSVADGENGIYNETIGQFPTQSYNKANYFRDVVFTPDQVTGIDEKSDKSVVVIYPNPTTGVLNIQAPEKSAIEIIDLTGRTVYSGVMNSNIETIDLSGNQGVFVVKVSNEVVQKVIVK